MDTTPSENAIDKYLKRVDPAASRRQAFEAILALLSTAKRQGRKDNAILYTSGPYSLIVSSDDRVVITVYPTEDEHGSSVVRPEPGLYGRIAPPKFIAIEGIDGAGKSTLAEALAAAFPSALHVACNRTTAPGLAAREVLLGRYNDYAVQACMVADKYVLDRVIREALCGHRMVVADRWSMSALAYAPPTMTSWLQQAQRDLVRPGLTLCLDLPVADAMLRIKNRGADPYETQARLFAAQECYRAECARSKSWLLLDATQDAAVVFEQAQAAIARMK